MKKITLIFIAFFIGNVGYSQTTWDEAGITKMIEEYSLLVDKGEWGKAFVEYTHPVLFNLVSKEEVVEKMDKMLNDPEMQVKMSNYKLKEIGKLIPYKGDHYALFQMSFTMTMTFRKSDEETDNMQEESPVLNMTATALRSKYGEDNVRIDKEKNALIVNTTSNTLAIGEKEIGTWKMLEYQKEQLNKLGTDFIPKKVRKKLDKQMKSKDN